MLIAPVRVLRGPIRWHRWMESDSAGRKNVYSRSEISTNHIEIKSDEGELQPRGSEWYKIEKEIRRLARLVDFYLLQYQPTMNCDSRGTGRGRNAKIDRTGFV